MFLLRTWKIDSQQLSPVFLHRADDQIWTLLLHLMFKFPGISKQVHSHPYVFFKILFLQIIYTVNQAEICRDRLG